MLFYPDGLNEKKTFILKLDFHLSKKLFFFASIHFMAPLEKKTFDRVKKEWSVRWGYIDDI